MQLAIPINEVVPLLRSIPSFSPSAMGAATQTLTPQDVVALYTESVVYIEVATVINWQSVLPAPSAVSGWPDEEAYDPSSWEQWLTSLGFPVAGVAGLSSPSPEGGGFYNAVVMVAFPEAQSAQSALDLLLHQGPPIAVDPKPLFTCEGSSPVLIGEGVDNPGSTGARWEFWFNVCRNTVNLPAFGPRPGSWSVSLFAKLVVAQRNLAFRISVGWSGEYGDYDTNSMPYSFQDGYLLLGGERYLSGDELLRRLEQLGELVIVTATNKLAGQ